MNDKRFIELLNLYVDQELTEAEARALEQEIAQRPDRRRVYTQYCRMQRACVRLYEQQSVPAPRVASLAAAVAAGGPDLELELPAPASEPVVVRPQRWGWATWGSGLAVAAAACVALVAVRLNDSVTPPTATGAQLAATAKPEPQAAVEPSARSTVAPQSDYRPVVVVNALLRPGTDAGAAQPAGLAALDPSSLDWLQEMKLLPMSRVPFETLRFDPQGRLQPLDQTAFANDQSDQPIATEISAFQFQR